MKNIKAVNIRTIKGFSQACCTRIFRNKDIKNDLYSKGASIVGYADLREINKEKFLGFEYCVSTCIAACPRT